MTRRFQLVSTKLSQIRFVSSCKWFLYFNINMYLRNKVRFHIQLSSIRRRLQQNALIKYLSFLMIAGDPLRRLERNKRSRNISQE